MWWCTHQCLITELDQGKDTSCCFGSEAPAQLVERATDTPKLYTARTLSASLQHGPLPFLVFKNYLRLPYLRNLLVQHRYWAYEKDISSQNPFPKVSDTIFKTWPFGKYLLPDSVPAQTVKNPSAMQETQIRSLGREDPLGKGMAAHSSILAWRIPWTEEPGGVQSIGLQRVGHD